MTKMDSARRNTKRASKRNHTVQNPGRAGFGARARQARKVARMEAKQSDKMMNDLAKATREKEKKHKRMMKRRKKKSIDPDQSDDEIQGEQQHAESDVANAKLGESLVQLDFSNAAPFKRRFWPANAPQMEEEELKRLRQSMGIKLKATGGPLSVGAPVHKFTSPLLPKSFSQYTATMPKLVKPTPVQQQCWPAILDGHNLLGIAPTGSGKTLAYLLPAVPHIMDQPKPIAGDGPISLTLVPTRELAIQVSECSRSFRKLFNQNTQVVYGGQEKALQIDALLWAGVHFLVGTPGRVVDLLETGALKLGRVTYFVIDEADRMLALGFEEQLNMISSQIRPDRQTLLFSATFPGKLREASQRWLSDPVTIRVNVHEVEGEDADESVKRTKSSSLAISETITQRVEVCSEHKKPKKLIRFIEKVRADERENQVRNCSAMLIFCTKIKTLRFVYDFLKKQKHKADILHGQLPQSVREAALARFKSGASNILIATDVAARGLHINHLKYVINYDFPVSLEQYAHRIGRTGRNGATGFAFSFFTRNLAPLAKDLVKILERYNQKVDPFLQELVTATVPEVQNEPEVGNSDEEPEASEESEGFDEIFGEDDFDDEDSEEEQDDSDAETTDAGSASDGPAVADSKNYGGLRIQKKVKLESDSEDSDDDMETTTPAEVPAALRVAETQLEIMEKNEAARTVAQNILKGVSGTPTPNKPKIKKEKAAAAAKEATKKNSGKLIRPRGKRGGAKNKKSSSTWK